MARHRMYTGCIKVFVADFVCFVSSTMSTEVARIAPTQGNLPHPPMLVTYVSFCIGETTRVEIEREFFDGVYWGPTTAVRSASFVHWHEQIDWIVPNVAPHAGIPRDVKHVVFIERNLANEQDFIARSITERTPRSEGISFAHRIWPGLNFPCVCTCRRHIRGQIH